MLAGRDLPAWSSSLGSCTFVTLDVNYVTSKELASISILYLH